MLVSMTDIRSVYSRGLTGRFTFVGRATGAKRHISNSTRLHQGATRIDDHSWYWYLSP